MPINDDIVFYGDPHGDYRDLKKIAKSKPRAVIFLGDMDLEKSFDEVAKPLTEAGIEVHYIHGNHDTDQLDWYDNLFESKLGQNNLSCRVQEIGGIRVAGLGGVFRGKIWHPKDGAGEPRFKTRRDFLHANSRNKWRDGLPIGQRSTIFPEDLDRLSKLRADVLVTHEAPSCHTYGFDELDLLAEMMGVKAIVHGHHHEAYTAQLDCGIPVVGLDKAEIMKVPAKAFQDTFWAAEYGPEMSYKPRR